MDIKNMRQIQQYKQIVFIAYFILQRNFVSDFYETLNTTQNPICTSSAKINVVILYLLKL